MHFECPHVQRGARLERQGKEGTATKFGRVLVTFGFLSFGFLHPKPPPSPPGDP